MANDIPVKQIGEILTEVTNKLPKLIQALLSSLYSKEAGKTMGEAVGSFYQQLIESGIDKEEALNMTKDYLKTLKSMTENIKW